MSFDLFLFSFTNGRPSGLPRDAVQAAFGEHVRWNEDGSGWTQYDGTDGCHILISPFQSDPTLTASVSLNRPVADPRLWESLYQIMRLGNVALFFPGMTGPLVADPAVIPHLPPDMFDSLEQPVIVNNGVDILDQIRSS
jgi:hypothetical protein